MPNSPNTAASTTAIITKLKNELKQDLKIITPAAPDSTNIDVQKNYADQVFEIMAANLAKTIYNLVINEVQNEIEKHLSETETNTTVSEPIEETELPRSVSLRKVITPAAQLFPVGVTTIAEYILPANLQSYAPASWTMPAIVGNIQTGVRFVLYNELTRAETYVTRTNTFGASLTETIGAVDLNNDNNRIIKILFIANNIGTIDTYASLGQYELYGSIIL